MWRRCENRAGRSKDSFFVFLFVHRDIDSAVCKTLHMMHALQNFLRAHVALKNISDRDGRTFPVSHQLWHIPDQLPQDPVGPLTDLICH